MGLRNPHPCVLFVSSVVTTSSDLPPLRPRSRIVFGLDLLSISGINHLLPSIDGPGIQHSRSSRLFPWQQDHPHDGNAQQDRQGREQTDFVGSGNLQFKAQGMITIHLQASVEG